jgi:hypothetical protein
MVSKSLIFLGFVGILFGLGEDRRIFENSGTGKSDKISRDFGNFTEKAQHESGSLRLYDLFSNSLDITFWVKTFLRLLVTSTILNTIAIICLMFFLPVLDLRKKWSDQGYRRALIDSSEEVF